MKNVDRDLELQLRELNEIYFSPRQKDPGSKMCARDGRKLEFACAKAATRRAPRGRPPAWHSSNERTYQSFEAAVFVIGEMRTFRIRRGIKPVPGNVTKAFIDSPHECVHLQTRTSFLVHPREPSYIAPF